MGVIVNRKTHSTGDFSSWDRAPRRPRTRKSNRVPMRHLDPSNANRNADRKADRRGARSSAGAARPTAFMAPRRVPLCGGCLQRSSRDLRGSGRGCLGAAARGPSAKAPSMPATSPSARSGAACPPDAGESDTDHDGCCTRGSSRAAGPLGPQVDTHAAQRRDGEQAAPAAPRGREMTPAAFAAAGRRRRPAIRRERGLGSDRREQITCSAGWRRRR